MSSEQVLESRGIRITAMRLLIHEFMLNKKVALSLTDIENAFEKVDRTTLYRTIKTFEENGLVHCVEDGTGIQKYAVCEADCSVKNHQDLHLHFHCVICDKTLCLKEVDIPKINIPKGYLVEELNLVAQGKCKECEEKL